jgi:hypothetical protein
MGSSKKAYDDLCAIKGIGPARQRWLRNAFNTRTYGDLARLSAHEIESQLKADGQIGSRKAIETWLAEAQVLADQAAEPAAAEPDSAAASSLPSNSIAREDGWEPLASFVIEFQACGQGAQETRTAVHHVESDTDTHWPGIESSQICQWMVDQLPARVKGAAKKPQTNQSTSASRPVAEQLRISQVRILQPAGDAQSALRIERGKRFTGSVHSSAPFALEVDLELVAAAAASKAKRPVQCCALSYAYDATSQVTIPLGDTELVSLDAKAAAYTVSLPEAALPHGTYRLWVLVTGRDARYVHPDYVEVPAFQVT